MISRFTFLFLAVSLLLSAYGQSQQSKELYAKGISFFTQKEYKESLRAFQAVDSIDRQTGDTIIQLGAPTKWIAHCYYRLGETEKARKLNAIGYDLKPVDREEAWLCNSLLLQVQEYVDKQQYDEAEARADELRTAIRQLYGEENYNSFTADIILGCILYMSGQHQKAKDVFKETARCASQYLGYSSRHLGILLMKMTIFCLQQNDVETGCLIAREMFNCSGKEASDYKEFARKVLAEVLPKVEVTSALCDSLILVADKIYEPGSEEYVEALDRYVIKCKSAIYRLRVEKNDTLSARIFGNRYVENVGKLYGISDSHYYESLDYLLTCYSFADAEFGRICEQRLKIAEQTFKKNSEEWNDAIENYFYKMSIYHISGLLHAKDTLQARQQAEVYVRNMERLFGMKSEEYYNALDTYGECYDYHDLASIPLCERLLETARIVFGEKSEQALSAQQHLVDIGENGHDLEYALQNLSESKGDSFDLVDMHMDYGNYPQAVIILKNIISQLFDRPLQNVPLSKESTDTLYRAYLNLSISLIYMEKHDSLLAIMQPYVFSPLLPDSVALLFALNIVGANPQYCDAVMNRLVKERPAIKNMSAYPHRYAIMADGLANEYPEKALVMIDSIGSWWQQHGGINALRHFFITLFKARVYSRMDDSLGLQWSDSTLNAIKQVPDYQAMYDYQKLLEGYMLMYIHQSEYQKATDYVNELLLTVSPGMTKRLIFPWPTLSNSDEIREYNITEDDLNHVTEISLPILLHNERWNEARSVVNKIYHKHRHVILWSLLDDISSSHSTDDKIADYLLKQTGMLAYFTQSPQDVAMAYDAVLLGKQLYLNAQRELKEFVMQHGDQRTKSKMTELMVVRKQLDHAQTTAEADSLYIRMVQLEKQVVSDSQRSGDFTSALVCHWGDVQRSLRDHEVAVEFISIPFQSDTLYAALVLTPDSVMPALVPLQPLSQLSDSLRSPLGTYHALWQPLLKSLQYYKPSAIYFSPSGVLHHSPVEYAVTDSGHYLTNELVLCRLSSTRELLKRKMADNHLLSAVLYGGIDYDNADAKQTPYAIFNHSGSTLRDVKIIRAACSGFPYLTATLEEVNTISTVLQKSNKEVCLLTGSQASEQSFRALDGHSPSIIHVASHGFYMGGVQNNDRKRLLVSDVGKMTAEDKALDVAGLVFSGASGIFDEAYAADVMSDGILTARELSRLDLSNTSITVLSACETAAGQVSGDGVFGLQRGFKKAGVKSILMSLWKVDDEATCLLMTEFYRNWIGEKMTKHDALEAAKQAVRSHKEKGWDDPKYWAAFILLDGLD